MTNFKKIFDSVSGVSIDASYSGITAGVESSNNSVRADAEGKRSMLHTTIGEALRGSTISADGSVAFKLSDHQIVAAQEAAQYALNPMASVSRTMGSRASVAGEGDTTYNRTLTPTDFISDRDMKAGLESFEKVDASASLYFTVAYQSLALKQDPVAELFYPIVVVDPSKNGFSITTTITNLVTTVKRDLSGKAIKNISESLFKKLNDTSLFTLDANRLYPVVRDENRDVLYNPKGVSGISRQVTIGDGYGITTAPIRTDVKSNILTLSQPDELVSKGIVDDSDMLNTHLSIETIFLTLEGKDKDGKDVVDNFSRNIHGLPAVFTDTKVGDVMNLSLDYQTTITFRGDALTRTDNETTRITDLLKLAKGHYVNVDIHLKGDANLETSNFVVYAVSREFAGLFDAAGNEITSGDEYDKVKAVIESIKVPAVLPEAYAENSNGRFRAKTLATETKRYVYTLQKRHIIREVAPINGNSGDNVGQALIDFTTHALSKNGLLELVTSAAVIDTQHINTTDYGLASDMFFKTSYTEDIDVSTIVDGRESSRRETDITAALKLKIKNYATKMYTNSNYSKPFRAVYGDIKPTIIIGTDYNIGRYVESFEDETFNYVVRRSDDSLIAGMIYISFGIMGKERNASPTVFNYGVCGWSPETVLASQRETGGALTYETLHMPVYRHQTLLPIITVLSVSGIEAASGKIATYFVDKSK